MIVYEAEVQAMIERMRQLCRRIFIAINRRDEVGLHIDDNFDLVDVPMAMQLMSRRLDRRRENLGSTVLTMNEATHFANQTF